MSDNALPDIQGLQFRLRTSFIHYYRTNLAIRQVCLPQGPFIKHFAVQSLAKYVASRALERSGIPYPQGLQDQPFLVDQMDQDLRQLQIEGAAAVWLTHGTWRLRDDIEGVPEDLNYGLVMQAFEPIVAAADFIERAMCRTMEYSDPNQVPQTVLDQFDISQYTAVKAMEIAVETSKKNVEYFLKESPKF